MLGWLTIIFFMHYNIENPHCSKFTDTYSNFWVSEYFGNLRYYFLDEPRREKTCLIPYANNKGADQPAHPRSLFGVLDVRCLESIVSLDAIAEILTLPVASIVKQRGLSLTWWQSLKTDFLMTLLIWDESISSK